MKKKPVLAYILSSIAMVLVCFGYYSLLLIDVGENLKVLKEYYFQNASLDKEYLIFSHLGSFDIYIYISLVLIPLFLIILRWAVRGKLKANAFLTGLMFYPISSFYTHSFYEWFKYDYSSDILFLFAFSFSFFAIVLSIVSMQSNKQKLFIVKRIRRIVPISYLVLLIVLLAVYVIPGSISNQIVHNTDLFSLILLLVVLAVIFTKTVIHNNKNGYVVLPILVIALMVSVISQVHIDLDIDLISETQPICTLSWYHLDTIIAFLFSLLSILYFLYLCTRFDEEDVDG